MSSSTSTSTQRRVSFSTHIDERQFESDDSSTPIETEAYSTDSFFVTSRPTHEHETLSKADNLSSIQENDLLDGDYDEQASRQSFVEALEAWRSSRKPKPKQGHGGAPVITKSAMRSQPPQKLQFDEGTSTVPIQTVSIKQRQAQVEHHLSQSSKRLAPEADPTGLSYMDRLLLLEMRDRVKSQSSQQPSTDKPQSLFQQAPEQTQTVSNAYLDDEESMSDHVSDEEISRLLGRMGIHNVQVSMADLTHRLPSDSAIQPSKIQQLQHRRNQEISVHDVTQSEEEEILRALDQGRMVEVIPTTKMVVVEPEDG
eukprot:jgi/Hompol1/1863/HPOL_003758-RA